MRARAEVHKVPLAVKADLLALSRVLFNQLQLIRLVLHQFLCRVCIQLELFERQPLLHKAGHLLLDLLQVLRRESFLQIKVVIKAVVNCRADGELGVGIEAQHRLCKQVRRRMPERAPAVFVVKR